MTKINRENEIKIVPNKTLDGYWGKVGISVTKFQIYVTFNKKELRKYPHLIDWVIAHEFCHIWSWLKTGNLSHGKYWKELMEKAGYKPLVGI
jgi:predicted SprT family Zn-dependent metalloprotease